MTTPRDNTPRRSWRRFLQFRLRSILLLTFVVAVGMFWYTRLEVIEEHPLAGHRLRRHVYRDPDGRPINHGWWELFDEGDRLICRGKYRSDKPAGEWTFWYPDRQMRQRGEFRDGQRHGPWVTWYEDGQRQEEVTYLGGMLHGPTRAWWASGQLKHEGQFDADERGGLWKFYSEQGEPAATGPFELGREEGTWLVWDDAGRPLPPRHFSAGRLVENDYKLLDTLRQRLHSASYTQRIAAAQALQSLGLFGMPVLDDATRSRDPAIRGLALIELAKQSAWAGANVPRLVAALDDDARKLQQSAMLALSRLGPAAKEAVPKLQRLLGDEESELRTCVLATLVSIAPENKDLVEEFVLALGQVDPAIYNTGPPFSPSIVFPRPDPEPLRYVSRSAVPAICGTLRSDRAEVRIGAALVLGRLAWEDRIPRPLEVVHALIDALSDSDAQVRSAACWALSNLGPAAASAEPHLVKAAKDPDPNVAQAAETALQAIKGGGQRSAVGCGVPVVGSSGMPLCGNGIFPR